MSLSNVIEAARTELGYTESPPGSNRTKYGEAFGWDGVPWCAIFLWWCFREAGEGAAYYGGAKTASCGTLLSWYREQGREVPLSEVRAGDILILNFSGTKDTQHCALVERVVDPESGIWRTIEGNTSPGLEGSQISGGSVALKVRHRKNAVGAARPPYRVTDWEGHWAAEHIRRAIRRGLMTGYEDGTWRPDAPVTRGELAAVLGRLEEGK